MTKVLCYSCRHRKAIPGNAHIRCGARVTDAVLNETPLLNAMALLSRSGFGWASFDPSYPRPVIDCEFFEDRNQESKQEGEVK